MSILGDTRARSTNHPLPWRVGFALAIGLLALFAELSFSSRVDYTHLDAAIARDELYDEPIYVQAAYDWAIEIRSGRPLQILADPFNAEHPGLAKELFAGAILLDWQINGFGAMATPPGKPDANSWVDVSDFATYLWNIGSAEASPADEANPKLKSQQFTRYVADARAVAIAFGFLTVVLLSLYSPWAGLLALGSTPLVKYSSIAYLDVVGVFFATLAVVIYLRGIGRRRLLLALAMIGLAAAAKYYFALAGLSIALAYVFGAEAPRRERLIDVFRGAALAAGVFAIADVPFWTQGFPAMISLIRAHGVEYGSGWSDTQTALNAHWYSLLTFVGLGFRSWYEGMPWPFVFAWDKAITVLAVLGFAAPPWRLGVFRIWLISALGILALYPVKYPQYAMLAIVPYLFVSASGAEFAVRQLRRFTRRASQGSMQTSVS